MKRIILLLIVALSSVCGLYADTLPYLGDSIRNLKYYTTNDYLNENAVIQSLQRDQNLTIIYIVSVVVLLLAALVVFFVHNAKTKQYSKIVALQNQELQRIKYQSDMFGYVLNASLFPCCLVNSDGVILWSNDAFNNFYGIGAKNFDIFSGTDGSFDKDGVIKTKLPTSFHVKIKDSYSKVFGFKRTIVPLKNGENKIDYAVIENICV